MGNVELENVKFENIELENIEFEKSKLEILENQISHQIQEIQESQEVWDFYKDETITREINSNNINVDIDNIVDDICEVIQLHLGDLSKFKKILDGVKLNIKNLCYSEKNKKEVFEKIKDENEKDTNIIFVFVKETNDISYLCDFFCNISHKEYKINIKLLITKAGNKLAEIKTNEFINKRVHSIFSGFCSSSKNRN